uniref:RRM domain-containing protein n=1 Tax=Caenorhabditis japonica TaxID=281687 RepID=A0A8R1EKB5_CAEJA
MSDTELHQAFGGAEEGVVQCHVADGYGFVLFDTRENARRKISEMDGAVLNGKSISVTWARPDTFGRKRKRQTSEERTPTILPPSTDLSNLSVLLKRPLLSTQLLPQFAQNPILPTPIFPLFPSNFPFLIPQNQLTMGGASQQDFSQYLKFL